MNQHLSSRKFITIYLGLLLLIGFGLRLDFLLRNIFHPDEFISLLAVARTIEIGIPVFPSGQFYDHGLLFTYAAAAFASIAGLSEPIVRWVSLLFSVLTLPVMYILAKRLFGSKIAGSIAIFSLAIYPQAIFWGGLIRMYSLAQFLALTALLLIWLGLIQPSRHYRIGGYLFLLGSLFTHLAFILIVPALVTAGLVLGWQNKQLKPQSLRKKTVWLEIFLVIGFISVVVLVGQTGFIPRQSANREVDFVDKPNNIAALAESVFDPTSAGYAVSNITHYFEETENKSLVALSAMSIIILVIRMAIKKNGNPEKGVLFVTVILTVLLLEVIFVLGSKWNNGRYYYLWFFPLFILLSGYGTAQLALLGAHLVNKSGYQQAGQYTSIIVFLLIAGGLGLRLVSQSLADFNESFKIYRYDLGWRYVAENANSQDIFMTSWPSAAWLYGPSGSYYYLNQQRPLLMVNPTTNKLTDKYAGAEDIDTTSKLNAILDQPNRAWYVVEDARIFNFLEVDFIQQIFHQMVLEKSFGNIHVFVEKEERWPLADAPSHPSEIDLSGQVLFKGYDIQPAQPTPGVPVYLSLFWQPVAPVFDYNIFVHMRDSQDNTVAQADFVPLENSTFTLKDWARRVNRNTPVGTGTAIRLPPDLPPGDYSLWIGLYEPTTFQRLPITNDLSGENAIKLGNVKVN